MNKLFLFKNALKHLFFLIFITILFTACHGDTYRHFIPIPGTIWNKGDKIAFRAELETSTLADAVLVIRRHTAYPHDDLKIKIYYASPQGEKDEMIYTIPFKDKSGKQIGDVMGELWDIEHTIIKNRSFDKGKHSFEVVHLMDDERLPLISEMGIRIIEQKTN